MKIEFELSKEDLIDFYIFHTQNDKRVIKTKKNIRNICSSCSICLCYFAINNKQTQLFFSCHVLYFELIVYYHVKKNGWKNIGKKIKTDIQ